MATDVPTRQSPNANFQPVLNIVLVRLHANNLVAYYRGTLQFVQA